MALSLYVPSSDGEVGIDLREVLFKSPSVHMPTRHVIRNLLSYAPDEGGIPILTDAYALVPRLRAARCRASASPDGQCPL
ncbi:hypothetical protein RSO01_62260 [Reyranella soli]|uniref:Uncharacterized protein n=1 Tax=Reyranella soli TaxID=1230389 RepID=A0A512NJD3_9HYPH|nr:hypothetical protein RSO01_62260 [Reyranella soli]